MASSRPNSRPASPVQNIARPSSPRPAALLKGFRRRMTSAFRKDSKTFGLEPEESNLRVSTSVPDLTLESSQASEPIEESVDPPPAVPQPVEPPNGMPPSLPNVVEPTEPQLPEVAVPLEEPAAEITDGLQAPEPEVAEGLSESPQIMPVEERVGMDIEDLNLTSRPDVQFENHIPSRPPSSYNSEHAQDDSDNLAPVAVLNDPEELSRNNITEEGEATGMESQIRSQSVAPTFPMPYPVPSPNELPVVEHIAQPSEVATNPFGTPASTSSSLGDNARILQYTEPSWREGHHRAPSEHPSTNLPWEIKPFSREDFDHLVQDFVAKTAAHLQNPDEMENDWQRGPSSHEHDSSRFREYPEVFTESSAGGDEIHAPKAPMAFNHAESPHLHEVREVLDDRDPSIVSGIGPNAVDVTEMPTPNPSKGPSWQEHRLPDGALYWSRQLSLPSSSQSLQLVFVVTDLDLRESEILSRVDFFLSTSSAYIARDLQQARKAGGFKVTLEGDGDSEVWITPSNNAASSTMKPLMQSLPGAGPNELKIIWVDHATRTVRETDEDKKHARAFQDEVIYRMALEYSYWSFVEAHPAHRSSSDRDQDEALEFLAWCFTADQLMHPDQGMSFPFTREQCTELMALFNTIDSSSSSRASMLKTRVVAKISLQNLSWRQALYTASQEETPGPQQVSHLAENETIPPPDSNPVPERHDTDEEDDDDTPLGLRRAPPAKKGVIRDGVSLIASVFLAASRVLLWLPMRGAKAAASAAQMTGLLGLAHATSGLVMRTLGLNAPPPAGETSISTALPSTSRPHDEYDEGEDPEEYERVRARLLDNKERRKSVSHSRTPSLQRRPPPPTSKCHPLNPLPSASSIMSLYKSFSDPHSWRFSVDWPFTIPANAFISSVQAVIVVWMILALSAGLMFYALSQSLTDVLITKNDTRPRNSISRQRPTTRTTLNADIFRKARRL